MGAPHTCGYRLGYRYSATTTSSNGIGASTFMGSFSIGNSSHRRSSQHTGSRYYCWAYYLCIFMTNSSKNKQNNNRSTGSIVAGVAGAVAVIGVAVATAVALKDKKTTEKVKKAFNSIKNQAIDYIYALEKKSTVKEEFPKAQKNKKSIKKNSSASIPKRTSVVRKKVK